jgi:predicted ATPase
MVDRTPLPSGEVTFLMTDIEGSTGLFRRLGRDYARLLDAHNAIIAQATERHGGVVVRTIGDAVFCAFAHAPAAVAAALDAQRALAAHPWPSGGVFRVRMGLHTGEGTPHGDDYVSLAVHQAARVSDAAHGEQVIASEATRVATERTLPAGARYRPLGPHRLRGFDEPAPLYQLCHPDLRDDFGPLRALPAGAHNVPEPATLFVGRELALDRLGRLVRNRRLVSVIGAGGVGKTRLVVELVPRVSDAFPDGVWLVELDRLGRGADVVPEVAGALGIRTGTDELSSTLDALRGRELLLVLDNCEHVLDSAAALAARVVADCPRVSLLCTSREPLGLPVEQRFPLAPLSVPSDGVEAATSEAVALFVERASAVAPDFELEREARAVTEICRRLDGLPLAIELAAARVAAIPVGVLAQRLDRRFSVLRRGRAGSLRHHETLAASIGWSVELLEPDEKTLFTRLCVFRGPFDLEAVEAVCAEPPLDPHDALDLLARLVEQSLVQPVDDRHALLDSIREYARSLAAEDGVLDDLRRRHLAHYVEVAEACARTAHGPDQRTAYDRLDRDLANIRAAVEFALERGAPEALRLAAALGQYGFVRNRLAEVAHWCIDAAGRARDAPEELRARALTQAGFALSVLGEPARGRRMLDEGVALARAVGDEQLLVDTLVMAAEIRVEGGSGAEARPLAEEALVCASRLGDARRLARAMFVEAVAAHAELGYPETHRRLRDAAELFERAHDERHVARARLAMAFLSLDAGELDVAHSEAARCIDVAERIGHPIGRAMGLAVQMWVAIERQTFDSARELHRQVVGTARDSGYLGLLGMAVAATAVLAVRDGEPERAARALGTLEASPEALRAEDFRAVAQEVERLRAALQAELGADRYTALTAEGAARPLSEMLEG